MTFAEDNFSDEDAPEGSTYLHAPSLEPHYPSRQISILYSTELAERITDAYIEGRSLHQIARDEPGMPSYATILKWVKTNTEFSSMLVGARVARALAFEDEAMEAARGADDPKEVPAARLQFEAAKWGAEVNDPTTFGKSTTIKGDAKRPIQFVLSTGFPPPLPHQEPPKLGPDGLIIRTTCKPVEEAAMPPAELVARDVGPGAGPLSQAEQMVADALAQADADDFTEVDHDG